MSNNLAVSTKLTQVINGNLGEYNVELFDLRENIIDKEIFIYSNLSHKRSKYLTSFICVGVDADTNEVMFVCVETTNRKDVMKDIIRTILKDLAYNGNVVMHNKNNRYLYSESGDANGTI